jgi:hypothetical protein
MMLVRFPALDDVFCPKCLSSNHGRAVTVWEVSSPAGSAYECDCCARVWIGDNPGRVDSKGQPVDARAGVLPHL